MTLFTQRGNDIDGAAVMLYPYRTTGPMASKQGTRPGMALHGFNAAISINQRNQSDPVAIGNQIIHLTGSDIHGKTQLRRQQHHCYWGQIKRQRQLSI